MKYNDEQWEQLIAQADASGLSGEKWCMENNISFGAYRYHKYSKGKKKVCNSSSPECKLVKVNIADKKSSTPNNGFDISIGKATIKVDSVASLDTVAKLINLINEA